MGEGQIDLIKGDIVGKGGNNSPVKQAFGGGAGAAQAEPRQNHANGEFKHWIEEVLHELA